VIDRAGADAELLARTGRFLAAAQIATATGGSPARVAAFDGAESLALAFCGVALDDPSAPADADFARLPAALWFRFLDIAELRLLETASAALSTRNVFRKLPDVELHYSEAALHEALAAKRAFAREAYGYGVGSLAPGVVRVGRRCRPEF